MIVYFYNQTYEIPCTQSVDYKTLLSEISNKLEIPSEELVIHDISNQPLNTNDSESFSKDSQVIAYEKGRVILDGFNKEGSCYNKNCHRYSKPVTENCGFVLCERVFVGCTGNCPLCSNPFEVSKIYLKNCHFSYNILTDGKSPIRGNEIDAIDIRPEDYDLDFDSSVEYDFTVQKMDCYVCKVCHRFIAADHDCERVHKRSICNSCAEWFVCSKKTYYILYFNVLIV